MWDVLPIVEWRNSDLLTMYDKVTDPHTSDCYYRESTSVQMSLDTRFEEDGTDQMVRAQ